MFWICEQTDKQTDTLVAILRTFSRDEVIKSGVDSVCEIAWLKQGGLWEVVFFPYYWLGLGGLYPFPIFFLLKWRVFVHFSGTEDIRLHFYISLKNALRQKWVVDCPPRWTLNSIRTFCTLSILVRCAPKQLKIDESSWFWKRGLTTF